MQNRLLRGALGPQGKSWFTAASEASMGWRRPWAIRVSLSTTPAWELSLPSRCPWYPQRVASMTSLSSGQSENSLYHGSDKTGDGETLKGWTRSECGHGAGQGSSPNHKLLIQHRQYLLSLSPEAPQSSGHGLVSIVSGARNVQLAELTPRDSSTPPLTSGPADSPWILLVPGGSFLH